jgi:hypothetical protein
MPEDDKYLLGLYDNLGGQAKVGSFEGFKTAMGTSDEYRQGTYNTLKARFGEGIGSFESFEELTKKKDGGTIPQLDGSPERTDGVEPVNSTTTTPQAITSTWGLDESGKPNFLSTAPAPTVLLNTRQRSDFARANGYIMSPEKQSELASQIAQRPLTSEQKEKDTLIDFIGSNTPDIVEHEMKTQRRGLVDEGKVGLNSDMPMVAGLDIPKEISTRTEKALREKGIPRIEDARAFVDEALANKDYKTIRQVVNSIYGYQDEKLKGTYSFTEPTSDNKTPAKNLFVNKGAQFLNVLSLGIWDGVSDQYDKEVAPLRQEKNRVNMLLDAVMAPDYAINNPKIKDDYEKEYISGDKPMSKAVTPAQYSGLVYFRENNPEMYNKMNMELSKSTNPALFGYKAYDKSNRDYQYMMYQLDQKGLELNGMAIDQRASALSPQKKAVDVEYRTQVANLTKAIQAAPTYEEKAVLQQQLTETQTEYASNPVIQEFGRLSADAQSIEVNLQEKYPDFASQSRERMVKDILQDDLKGGNLFIKVLNEFGERMKWLVANTSDALGNVTGVSEVAIGNSRNYFRTLRRGELQQEEMYQPAASAAVEPLYKLNFNTQDYETIKAIKYSDMEDKEKTKAIADYLDANQERIRYVENPNAGKQNWAFGAIGNQIGDVGSQIIYQGALTYLTAGAGRALLGVRAGTAAVGAAEAGLATEGAEALSFATFEGGSASLTGAVDLGIGLNQTSLAVKSKIIHLGSVMGATYATAYQPAYFQAIQEGKSEEEASSYANEIALVNALSETISPDIDILKRSLNGVGGLSQIVTEGSLGRARRFGQATRAFAKGYLKNTGMETLEEIGAAYGEYGVDAMHNMDQNEMNTLQQRVQQATWTTLVGMAPFGGMAGFSTVRANNRLQREAFYQAGVHPEIMRGEITQLIQDGGLSQEEGNRRIQMVNTMEHIVTNLPDMNDGTEMTSEEKMQYAWNEAQARAYKNQGKALPEGSRKKRQYSAKEDEYNIANDKILEGRMRSKASTNTDENGQPNQTGSESENGQVQQENQNQNAQSVQENGSTTEAGQEEQPILPTVDYAPGSTIETKTLGEVKVISENKGVYTLEMPDGSHEEFTGAEIVEDLKPIQRTPVSEASPSIAQENTDAVEAAAPPASQQPAPAPVETAAPASNNTPATQSVIDNVTVDDHLNTNLALTEYGKEYVRKNEAATIKETQEEAQNAFDYLDGKITAREYIVKNGNNSSAYNNEQAEEKANRDSKYWSKLREQAITDQTTSNEQQSTQESASAAANANSIQEAPPAADQSPSADEAIISPVNEQTNEQESTRESSPNQGTNLPRNVGESQNRETATGIGQGMGGNENESTSSPTGQERESNAPIREGDGQINTANEADANSVQAGGDNNQSSNESNRVRSISTDSAGEGRVAEGNESDGGTSNELSGNNTTTERAGNSSELSTDTGATDGVVGESEGENASEEPIDDTAGLSEEEQRGVRTMSIEDLYNNILAVDPNSPIRNKAGQYSKAELEIIYKGALAAQQEAAPAGQASQQSPVSQAAQKVNEAQNLLTKKKADLDAVKNKNSTEYQAKKKFYESAQQKLKDAEKAYISAMATENSKLFRQKRGNMNSGIPFGKEDARIIANYVQMAKIYLNQGVRSLNEFASQIGEKVNEHMRRAWGIVTEEPAPLKKQGETYKEYLARLKEWEQDRVNQSEEDNTPEASKEASSIAKELRYGVKKMTQGIALLQANPSMGLSQFNERLGLEADEYDTYVAVLKEMIRTNDNKITAQSVMNNLRENNPKKIVATEMSLLRRQMAYMERGSKLGYKAAQEEFKAIQGEIKDILQDLYDSKLLRSGNFSERDLINMGKMVNNVRNEEGIQKLSDFLQKLIDNSSLAATLQDVRSLQKRLSSLIKSNSVLTANRGRRSAMLGVSVLRAMNKVNPLQVGELLRFNGLLSNVVNSLEGKEVLTVSDDDVINFIDGQNQLELNNRAADLKDRYTKTLAIADENNTAMRVNEAVSQDEFNSMVDTVMNNRELSREGKLNELKALRNALLAFEREVEEGSSNYVNLAEVYDQIRAVNNTTPTSKVKARLMPMIEAGKQFLSIALQATDFNATDQQRDWVKSMIELNVDNMSNKELSLFKNVIDNIFVNNDFSGVEAYDAKYKGQQRVQGFVNWLNTMGKTINRQAFSSKLGAARELFTSVDMVASAVANNDQRMAAQLFEATGLGDIKALHSQAKRLLEEQLVTPLKNLYKKHKNDGLRTFESNFKRSMYAYLSQNNLGNVDDVQREFDRRKGILFQDIAIKANSDEQADIEEAAALKEIYDKYFDSINSYQELQDADILTPAEREVYDLFRNFYDEHKEQFRQVSESLLNRPFSDVNNYVKDSYKTLNTNITEGDLANIGSSGFTPATNINIASNATLARNSFTNLNSITVTDPDGRTIGKRVLNHDFDNIQIYNATSMMEDIYTLKTRMEAMEALEDPLFKQTVGLQNMKVLARNVENQVKSQMNMRKRGINAGAADIIAQDVANSIQKIGARHALIAGGQLIKQSTDILVNTMTNMGREFTYILQSFANYPMFGNSEMKGHLNRLFDQSEIGLRGHTMGGTAWLGAHAISEIKNTLKRVGKNAELDDADKLAWLIEAPDTYTAKLAWMAYYAQSLKKQGLADSYKEVNWKDQADNINREARDYAQIMTSSRLNVNSKASQSEFFAKASGGLAIARAILLPFSSFNMNNNALLANDIATLISKATREQKVTALTSIGSRMAAEVAFQAARGAITGFILKPAAIGIMSLLGVPHPEPKDEDFWHKVLSEATMNMFFGMLGNFSTDFMAKNINTAVGDDDFVFRYKDNPNARPNTLAGLSLAINPNLDALAYTRDVFRNYTNKKGEDITTTPQEKALLMMTALYNVAGNFGYAEGDTKRILNRVAQQITKNKATERGDPFYMLMNDPNRKPKIKINHKEVQWNPEQLQYYEEQRAYHIQQSKSHKNWTDEYRARNATERAKQDLQNKFKGQLNLVKPDKK